MADQDERTAVNEGAAEGRSPLSTFLLGKDAGGLRALQVFRDGEDEQRAKAEHEMQERGCEVTSVAGFGVEDVMQSHPAWFRVMGARARAAH